MIKQNVIKNLPIATINIYNDNFINNLATLIEEQFFFQLGILAPHFTFLKKSSCNHPISLK